MKLTDRFKLAFDAIKTAKILWTVIAALSAYSSYHGYNDVSEYMADPVVEDNSNVQKLHNAKPASSEKDWLPVINERISKAVKRLEYEYHGGS